MATINVLEVIYFDDDFISKPDRKMVVCVAPEAGFFFRINTNPFRVAVKLLLADSPFLKWDSHLECAGPLDLDDYTVQQHFEKYGPVLGVVAAKYIPDIWNAVQQQEKISAPDAEIIGKALGVIP